VRFAFLTAMELELRPLARMLPPDAVTAVIGVGPEPARRATEAVLAANTVDHVVVVGVAGGVDPTLRIGDVVMPALVVHRETGARHRHHPVDGRATAGTLLTCTEPILDLAVIATLCEQDVVALDMETAAVAEVCEAAGVGWSVFRAISDRPSDGLVDADVAALARTDGSPDLPAVARYVVRRRWAVPTLARLGRDLCTATMAAARAAMEATGVR
jgi:adenosylhomocysteine nucleosidase